MEKELNDLLNKMVELQRENDKLTEKLLQEADINEQIMIESKTDKEVFASMKK